MPGNREERGAPAGSLTPGLPEDDRSCHLAQAPFSGQPTAMGGTCGSSSSSASRAARSARSGSVPGNSGVGVIAQPLVDQLAQLRWHVRYQLVHEPGEHRRRSASCSPAGQRRPRPRRGAAAARPRSASRTGLRRCTGPRLGRIPAGRGPLKLLGAGKKRASPRHHCVGAIRAAPCAGQAPVDDPGALSVQHNVAWLDIKVHESAVGGVDEPGQDLPD